MTDVILTRTDEVAIVTLDGAPLNLITPQTVAGLSTTFAKIRSAYATIITGANSVFSAGVDTQRYSELSSSERVEFARAITRMTLNALKIEGPVVCAIPGHAIGGGFVLSLCSDYRLVRRTQNMRFALSEASAGVAFPAGPASVIQQEMPRALLRYMTMSSAAVSKDELLGARVFDEEIDSDAILEHALDVAKSLAAQSGFTRVKAQMRHSLVKQIESAVDAGYEPGSA